MTDGVSDSSIRQKTEAPPLTAELTRPARQLHVVIREVMWFVHRAQVDPKVLVVHVLDGERDVSRLVA